MRRGPGRHRLHDAWWTLILFAVIGVAVLVTAVSFTGSLRSTVPVTLAADRSGLVMDSGAKVMMRGVQVGRVAQIGRIEWAQNGASLRLEIDPDQIRYIPANVEAQISATTAFGAKFVDLVMPQNPSRARLSAGAVLHSKNVSTEINTVFENVVDLLNMIDPLKLNAVLTAVADAVRGQGERIGQATTDLNEVLEALNARGDTIGGNWRSLKNFTDTYDAAAQDILTILNAASTTSATVVNHSTQLDALLLNAIGLSNAGTNLLGSSRDNLVGAADILAPTTSLLFKYNPEYTCFLQGAKWYLDNGGYAAWGGADGRTLQLDVALTVRQRPLCLSGQPAGCRGQGGSRRKAGMRAIAGCHPQLPGAPAGHQHRMGNRAGHPAQPRHRASLLGQLLPGDPRGARAAVDPSVHPRAGDRAQPRGGGAAMRENLGGVVVRLGVFLAVCLLTAFLLIAVFGEVRFGDGKTYYAEFANVSNLRTGKLVRIAGVEVGKVTRISINPDATVRVQFTADNSVTLTRGTRAVIRYDNLFGDRYLALEEGAGGLAVLRPGHTIPLARTQPALDLDALIGGFKPLFRALNPEQVNALSEQLLHAFAGQGPTIGSLLAQSAAVTNTLADRDRLIGQVITNLNVVLGSLGAHTDRLDQAVTSLSALIHRLAQRKTDISNAVAYTNAAAGSVADLLSQARAPLAKVVRETDRVAGIAAADHDYLDNLLNTLPDKYQALVRQGMYGDFFAFYLCDVVLKVNGKGGQPVYIKLAGQDSGRCAPK